MTTDLRVPVPLPDDLLDAIVRGARRGHDIAARAHNDEELWDDTTLGVSRHRLSVNWMIQEAAQVDGVTVVSDRGGTKHLCWQAFRFSFHNGGTDVRWNPHTYDFDRSEARRTMAAINGQLSMLQTLSAQDDTIDPLRLRELDVVMVGNAMTGCEVIYLGAPTVSDLGPVWGWIAPIWTRNGPDDGHADRGDAGGTPPRPPGSRSEFDGFRAIPEDDMPPLTVKPAAAHHGESESS